MNTGLTQQNAITDRLNELSERIRLRLLRLLEQEELSVGEVAQVTQLPQSTVSRHLKILAEGGWVLKRSEGTAALYRMAEHELSPGARQIWSIVKGELGEPSDVAEDTRRLASVLRMRSTDSQTFFGRIGGEWDAVRSELFDDGFTPLALLSAIPPEWTVADVGCGTGNASELLAPLVKRVYAIDQSTSMLDAARKRLKGLDNVEFVEGAAESVPLPDDAVDLSVCILVLHHIESPFEVCREMVRITRPGGVILIVDMLEHDRSSYRHTMGHRWLGFSSEVLSSHLGEAGVESVRYMPLESSPDALGPGLFVCRSVVPGTH